MQRSSFVRRVLSSAAVFLALLLLLALGGRPAAAGAVPDGLTAGDWAQIVAQLSPPAAPSQQAYLKASNAEAYDVFGYAVAVDGDTVVVGAPYEAGNGTGQGNNDAPSAGAVYIFTRVGTTWSQQAYLKASNAEAYDLFGYAVAVDGDTVVAGAYGEAGNGAGQGNNDAPGAGAAYVFTRVGATWSQQAYLKASNAEAYDLFGYAVAVDGDTVVAGAYGEAGNGTGQGNNDAPGAGAAYVFTRVGATWSQQAYLKASNAEAGDYFGYAVAVDGDTVVAGAPYEAGNGTGQGNNDAPSAGAAYVFTRVGATWSQQAYLKASNAEVYDYFGISVAVDGDTVVAGAYGEAGNGTGQGNNDAPYAGAAYVFTRVGAIWSQQAYLKASNAEVYDYFGVSVAVDGDTVVAGAPYEAGNGTGQGNNDAYWAGAAYVFDVALDTTPPDTTITANPPNPSNSSSATFTFSGDDGSGGSGVASFQCSLDGGSFTACSSPQNYSGLSDGSHTFQARAIDTAGNIDPTPAGYTWVINTTPPPTGALYVTARGGNVPGAGAYQKNDILKWNGSAWSVWFDGATNGLPATAQIAAFDVDNDAAGSVWVVIRQAMKLPGVGKMQPYQIAYYNGSTWSRFFDGSDVSLKTSGERINGLEVLPGSVSPIGSGCQYYLLISTVAGGGVPVGNTNVNFTGEDVLGFCMTSGGANTAGTWHVVFEGQSEGLQKNNNLGLSANADAGTLYFTTKSNFTGDGGLVKPSELFSFSGGVFSGPLWKAKDHGLNQAVDGIDVVGNIP